MIQQKIKERVSQNRLARRETQELAELAAKLTGLTSSQVIELCEARIALREMDENEKHTAKLLQIAKQLGYTSPEDDGALLQAVNEFAAQAKGHGYLWDSERGYFYNSELNRKWSAEAVRGHVDRMKAEWQQLSLIALEREVVSYE